MSNMGLSKYIDRIQKELSIYYQGGAINWVDENQGNAWSNAIDRFDRALLSTDKAEIKREASLYFNNCMGFIKEYKLHLSSKEIKESGSIDAFLLQIKNRDS